MFNINAANCTQALQKVDSGSKTATPNGGFAFVEAIAEAVQLGKIVVPTKAESTEITFEKNKLVNFENIKWDDEEEMINSFIRRIEAVVKKTRESE